MEDQKVIIENCVHDQKDYYHEEELKGVLVNFNLLRIIPLIPLDIEDYQVNQIEIEEVAYKIIVEGIEILKIPIPSNENVMIKEHCVQIIEICIKGTQGVLKVQTLDNCINLLVVDRLVY